MDGHINFAHEHACWFSKSSDPSHSGRTHPETSANHVTFAMLALSADPSVCSLCFCKPCTCSSSLVLKLSTHSCPPLPLFCLRRMASQDSVWTSPEERRRAMAVWMANNQGATREEIEAMWPTPTTKGKSKGKENMGKWVDPKPSCQEQVSRVTVNIPTYTCKLPRHQYLGK